MTKSRIDKIRSGVEKYQALRQQLFAIDVARDRDFQKAFNGFFRMGRRTEAYYRDYYCYLQQHKTTAISFSDALGFLYQRHGKREMSFVSKMVAMVDPAYPIWDSIVTKGHFGIIAPYANAKNRCKRELRGMSSIADAMIHIYNQKMRKRRLQSLINCFPEQKSQM